MKIFGLSTIYSITCAFSLSAQVIQYEIDPTFNTELLFKRGGISDILVEENGDFLTSGTFSGLLSAAGAIALLSENGSLIESLGVGGLQNFSHYKGAFITYGSWGIQTFGLSSQNIPSFNFEFSKSAYPGWLSIRAHDVIITSEDNIMVAGRFFTDSTLTGTSDSHLGLRHLCMVDSTGVPVENFPMLRCAEPVDASIYTLHQLGTGEFIVAGNFSEIDGYPYAKVAKLNADFSVDTTFAHVFGTSGTVVFTTLVDSQDRIWLKFGPNISILNQPNYDASIIRLLPNGEIDPNFIAPTTYIYTGGTYENPTFPQKTFPAGILEDSDGTFIVHGGFTEINGLHHRRVAKIFDNGELVEGAMQHTTADSAVWGNWDGLLGPVMSAYISEIEKLPDGKLLIGGQFSSFSGEPYSCLVRLQPNGIVGTNYQNSRSDLNIWPNPAVDVVHISLPEPDETLARIEICDLRGLVLDTVVNVSGNGSTIAINQLNTGVYLLRAFTDRACYSQKLIIQR